MASRRQETSLPNEDRSLRFYKVVALTFLFITIILVGSIIFMSSKRATINITSKTSPIEVNKTVSLSSATTSKNKPNTISGTVTTTQITLAKNFEPKGTEVIPATATGTITIINESNSPQPLVEETRFLSEDGVLFRLENGVTVPANGQVQAEAYADDKGKKGNIGPTEFTIPGLNSSRQNFVYGESKKPMTGGVESRGVISSQDMEMAKEKLKESVKKEAKEKFENLVTQDNQSIITELTNYTTTSTADIGSESTNFDLEATTTAVGGIYSNQKLQKFAKMTLQQKSSQDTEKVISADKDPTVSFKDYNTKQNEIKLDVYYTGKTTLDPDSEKIRKERFFGKSEQEVRRYLLSLDNVHKVEVDFSPSWISEVPHVPDHVNIVVKKVK